MDGQNLSILTRGPHFGSRWITFMSCHLASQQSLLCEWLSTFSCDFLDSPFKSQFSLCYRLYFFVVVIYHFFLYCAALLHTITSSKRGGPLHFFSTGPLPLCMQPVIIISIAIIDITVHACTIKALESAKLFARSSPDQFLLTIKASQRALYFNHKFAFTPH